MIGGNPASNHPRLMSTLMRVRRRGGQVIVVNPVVETGLVNFRVPVVVMIEPERLNAVITEEGKKVTGSEMQAKIDETEEEKDRLHANIMISKGLRAQLKTDRAGCRSIIFDCLSANAQYTLASFTTDHGADFDDTRKHEVASRLVQENLRSINVVSKDLKCFVRLAIEFVRGRR